MSANGYCEIHGIFTAQPCCRHARYESRQALTIRERDAEIARLQDERADKYKKEADDLRQLRAEAMQWHETYLKSNAENKQLRAERDDAVQALLAILAPLARGDTRVHGEGCFCDQCIADACLARLPHAGEGGKMSQGCKHGHLPPCTECARDEEIAVWQDRAAINGKEAFRIIDERDQLRAERDACVEALQLIDKAPGSYRGNLLHIARTTLAQLPHVGERAKLVEAVITASRGWASHYTEGALCTAMKRLDAFDREHK